MVYVIGGNTREAEDLVLRRAMTDCVALDDPSALRGLTAPPKVIVTGTFIARADVQAFYDAFRFTGATYRFMR